jgi:hypothetical protein
MADWKAVKAKYCDKCMHDGACHVPCPLVNAALWDLPCEQDIYKICIERRTKDGYRD